MSKPNLQKLGLSKELELYLQAQNIPKSQVGRVVQMHKGRYVVSDAKLLWEATLAGRLRFEAISQKDLPVVGDWVQFTPKEAGQALIELVLPRGSSISRQMVGKSEAEQVLAANIDYGFIVQGVDADFNLNRLQRYMLLCVVGRVSPIVVLSKVDLLPWERVLELETAVRGRVGEAPVVLLSNKSGLGLNELSSLIYSGKSYCLLGSSGVGKSSILNSLVGTNRQETRSLSTSTGKGRHTTTLRELVVLPTGGIIIDNPGIRQVGLVDSEGSLDAIFGNIAELAQQCKFRDCTHKVELGCAVREAVKSGGLDRGIYESYLKLKQEKQHLQATAQQRKEKAKKFSQKINKAKRKKQKV